MRACAGCVITSGGYHHGYRETHDGRRACPPARARHAICRRTLLQRTLGCPTVEAHQQALQGFLDELTPSSSPAELPTLLEQPFTLFDHLAFTPHGDGDDEDVWVALSPGGEIVFRAWLRQRGLDPLVCSSVRSGSCLGLPHRRHVRLRPPSPRRTPRSRQAKVNANGTRTLLQALGVQLVALSAAQLARLELPETLHEAVLAAQRMRAHGARTRQMQYIGKLMRQLEPAVLSRVRAALTPQGGPMARAWILTTTGVTSPRPHPSIPDSSHTGGLGLARSQRSDPTRPAAALRQHGRPPASPRRG